MRDAANSCIQCITFDNKHVDLFWFERYTLLTGSDWSSFSFSTRLRVLQLKFVEVVANLEIGVLLRKCFLL